MRWLKRIIIGLCCLFLVFLIVCNVWIVKSTESRVYEDLQELPAHRVALVLGTSHKLAGGKANPFFEKRMETAAELYRMGKIDHFILSGDNRSRFYNEPVAMRKALMKLGVPETAITLDYAGLRTLDSVVRCQKIFGQDKITIITQPFHSYRALFISQYYDIDAVAMVAEEPDFEYSFKVRLREYLARTKAVLDLYVLKTEPRFMGRKEELNS
ncbi:SanA/YdcF family protein [Parachryseolinea silvisoli]|jgi:SanA protein|uniref:SanA/YdcF family protein n=1 Tax=Parachryseolinea silvisoli TaxID=2873601 RepID=UPI0022659157|nr:ElyC/SanA/YdcF family protein [Parachryseolinea silvisoli]MCD9018318.1 YdcF family protein [Parachryseolinea silvisoli]